MPMLVYEKHDDTIAIPLTQERSLTIGKGAANSVAFPEDRHLSRRHCEIFFSREISRYILRDLDSKNGSKINERTVKNDIAFLSHGDRINIGKMTFRFSETTHATDPEETVMMPVPGALIDGGSDVHTPVMSPRATRPHAPIPATSTPSAAPAILEIEIGAKVGGCSIVRELGAGPTFTVCLANQSALSRVVALKLVAAHSPAAVEDFLAAIHRVAPLNHPAIPPYFDAGEQSGFLYVAMPYLPDGSLAERVSSKPLPETEALEYLVNLAEGLEYALKEFKITHQNIKSSNIFFDDEYDGVLLSDFGFGEWAGKHGGAQTNWLPGSAAYSPPERTLGESVDWRGDQYSLGIVLYEMLVGSVPFKAEDERQTALLHIKKSLPLPGASSTKVTVSDGTLKLLDTMTQKDPDTRYASWQDVIAAAKGCITGLAKPQPQSTTTPKRIPPKLGAKSMFNHGLGSMRSIGSYKPGMVMQRKPHPRG